MGGESRAKLNGAIVQYSKWEGLLGDEHRLGIPRSPRPFGGALGRL